MKAENSIRDCRPAKASDSCLGTIPVGEKIENGAVREDVTCNRLGPGQYEVIVKPLASDREEVVEDVAHGQHRRPDIDGASVDDGFAQFSARRLGRLENGDVAALGGQAHGCGKPADPRSDHCHVHGRRSSASSIGSLAAQHGSPD